MIQIMFPRPRPLPAPACSAIFGLMFSEDLRFVATAPALSAQVRSSPITKHHPRSVPPAPPRASSHYSSPRLSWFIHSHPSLASLTAFKSIRCLFREDVCPID